MRRIAMTPAEAKLDLALWQAEADLCSGEDLYVQFRELNIPSEIAIRLKELLSVVRRLGKKVISIGKIIAIKIVEFIRQHPNLSSGIALAAAVAWLLSSIPFLGVVLAPIALVIGIPVGAVLGHRMDQAERAMPIRDFGVVGLGQDIIEIVRSFLQHFVETLIAVSSEFGQ